MRKFFILGALLLFSLSAVEVAQSLQRTDKVPDFFIPTGVLQTEPHQEKLPDVKQMQYQGQQAPIITQMEQERLARIEAEKQKLAEEEKERQKALRKENLRAQRKAETQQKLENLEKNVASEAKKEVETVDNAPKEEIKIEVDENADIHTRILQEYVVDLEKISRGEMVENKRLQEMLADWTDDNHLVK